MLRAMAAVVDQLRHACAEVASRARHVSIERDEIEGYARRLPLAPPAPADDALAPAAPADDPQRLTGTCEQLAAFWLTLDAINFGSGWFPTLDKRGGRSGYFTIADGVRARFDRDGPWPAAVLAEITAAEIATALGQDPQHELMALFARSLRDLGERVRDDHAGRFEAVVGAAGGSAIALVELLGGWACFADSSRYDGLEIPFLKRAQIAAADLDRAGVTALGDRDRLTMFADNLVPHVLRLDGILRFEPALVGIDRGELLEHDSHEEIEIRACAVHAVELIVGVRPGSCAADVDQFLWNRGAEPRYKASPRHRSRCTAY
jgi:Potential Queuosine, Q, salvage protein family